MDNLEDLANMCKEKLESAESLRERLKNAPEGLLGGYRGEIRAYEEVLKRIETYK